MGLFLMAVHQGVFVFLPVVIIIVPVIRNRTWFF